MTFNTTGTTPTIPGSSTVNAVRGDEIGALLKEFFLSPVQEQLNRETVALELFEKARVSWAGRVAIVPVHLGAKSGTGSVSFSDGGTVPAAREQDYAKLSIDAKRLLARFQVDGMIMAAAKKGSSDQVINWMEGTMDALKSDVRDTMNTMTFSGGRILGFLNENKAGLAGASWEFSGDIVKAEAHRASGANSVEVIRLDTYAVVGAATAITSTSSVDSTIVLTNAIDTSAVPDGVAFAVQVVSTTEFASEPSGLYEAVGTQTYLTLDRTTATGTHTILQSNGITHNNSGTAARNALSLDRLQAAIDTVLDASGEDVDTIFMNPLTRHAYTALLQASLQVNGEKAGRGDGGFTGLSYGGVDMRMSRACGRGMLVLLTVKHIKILELEGGKFADFDGSALSRVSGNDTAEGYWKHYYNQVCTRPNAQAVLVGFNI